MKQEAPKRQLKRLVALLLAIFLCGGSAFAAIERTRPIDSLRGLMDAHPQIKEMSRIHLGDALSDPQFCLVKLAGLATSPNVDPAEAGIAKMILGLASRPEFVNESLPELRQLLGLKEAAAVSGIAQAFQKPMWATLREQAREIDFSRAHPNLNEALTYWGGVFDAAGKSRRPAVLAEPEFAGEAGGAQGLEPVSHKQDLAQTGLEPAVQEQIYASQIIGTEVPDLALTSAKKSRLPRLAALGRFAVAKIVKGKITDKAVRGLIQDLNSPDPKLSAFAAKLLPKLGAKSGNHLLQEITRREITQDGSPAEILAILGKMKSLDLIDHIDLYRSHSDPGMAFAAIDAINAIRSVVADSVMNTKILSIEKKHPAIVNKLREISNSKYYGIASIYQDAFWLLRRVIDESSQGKQIVWANTRNGGHEEPLDMPFVHKGGARNWRPEMPSLEKVVPHFDDFPLNGAAMARAQYGWKLRQFESEEALRAAIIWAEFPTVDHVLDAAIVLLYQVANERAAGRVLVAVNERSEEPAIYFNSDLLNKIGMVTSEDDGHESSLP